MEFSGKWQEMARQMAWKQPGIAFFPYILLQKHPVITFLSIKVEVGSRGRPLAGANGGKWSKIEFSGKWLEMARQWGGNSLE